MKKCSVVLTAALALVWASMAFAVPVELSNAQMDQVTAGQGVFDFVFGDGFTAAGDPVVAAVTTNAADNGSVAGNDNVTVPIDVTGNSLGVVEEGGALATDAGIASGADDNDGSALAQGHGNLALEDTDDSAFVTGAGSIGLADTDDNAVATAPGSVAMTDVDDPAVAQGTGNIAFADADASLSIGAGSSSITDSDDAAVAMAPGSVALSDNDDSIIAAGTGNIAQDIELEDNEIEEGGMGQIAYQASATNSFNRTEIELDVEVEIEDSFNVITNTLDISGQAGVTAIVLADTLGDQAIGVNLNIANASSTVPSAQSAPTIEPVTAITGNALALTLLDQTVINNSVFIGIGILPVDGAVTAL